MQNLRQLAAKLVLQGQQQEGHGDDACQQEEQEGAGGQLLGRTCERRDMSTGGPRSARDQDEQRRGSNSDWSSLTCHLLILRQGLTRMWSRMASDSLGSQGQS